MSKIKSSGLPLSQAEALIMLRSAIGYVLESGLRVGARNSGGGMVITIAGAEVLYHNGAADFVPQSSVPQLDVPQKSVAQPADPQKDGDSRVPQPG
jgi:hypothetical protein